jgi:hypothetical protein
MSFLSALFGFKSPQKGMFCLISDLRLLQGELQVASHSEPFDGLERFMEALSSWGSSGEKGREISRLVGDLESSTCPESEAIVTALFSLQLLLRDAVKAGAVARLMNRNRVTVEKTDLPSHAREVVRRHDALLRNAIDTLHRLAQEMAAA